MTPGHKTTYHAGDHKSDQAILDERAKRLAMPLADKTAQDTFDVVAFTIGAEKYIIESSYVMEVAKMGAYTPVPGTPNFVTGVTNLRGVILALIDLRKFLTLPARGVTDLTRIIVLGQSKLELGLLAQRVDQSYPLSRSLILETPDNISAGTKKYLKGVTAEAALFLDAKILLDDQRLMIDQETNQ
jgi:purine-binding chemotaxis protein CheW